MRSLLWSLLACACWHQPVWAETVERTEFDLPSKEWSPLANNIDGEKPSGRTSGIRHPFRAYKLLGGDGFIRAVLIVARQDIQNETGGLSWAMPCPPPRPNSYAQDFGTGKANRISQCLYIAKNFGPRPFFQQTPELIAGILASGTRMNGEQMFFRSHFGSSGGFVVAVMLITHASFAGLPQVVPNDQSPSEISAAHIAWGESLAKAVKDSLGGFGNKLVLPEIAFTTPSNAIATPPATSQKP
jgi:hypothetical protein